MQISRTQEQPYRGEAFQWSSPIQEQPYKSSSTQKQPDNSSPTKEQPYK